MVPNRVYKVVLQVIWSLLYFSAFGVAAQDSLRQKDYKYLFTRIQKSEHKPALQNIYLKAFLSNAKAANDYEMLMTAYKNYADYALDGLAITYSDSMVDAARRSHNDKLIGSAYLSKGIAYYFLKRHELALEQYLLAKPFIEKSGDDYLRYKLKYNIAQVKYYLGKNDQAITMFNSCLGYFKAHKVRPYLNTLHSLGLCYTQAGNYRRSEAFAVLGLEEAVRLGNHSMDAYFLHLDGQNEFFMHNYTLAIEKLEKAIPGVADNNDYANVAVANFYIGKSYWAMKRFSEGLPYLEKVAAAFERREYIRPDLRENFELLIQYYKNKNQYKKVLFYVDRLLKADSLLLKTHDNLYDNIHKNYDTEELVQERQNMKLQLSHERSYRKLLLACAALVTSIIMILLAGNRRRQNRIFRELLIDNKKRAHKPPKDVPKELEIAPETIEKILRLLEKWERAMRYLEMDITQTTMAVYLETNIRYLSDIILVYRGKKFPDYINDLKVDYIIKQLKTDKHKRMYTHDALAKEAGFSTTQRFVQAFKARTGISPSFFSEKIRKEMAEMDS